MSTRSMRVGGLPKARTARSACFLQTMSSWWCLRLPRWPRLLKRRQCRRPRQRPKRRQPHQRRRPRQRLKHRRPHQCRRPRQRPKRRQPHQRRRPHQRPKHRRPRQRPKPRRPHQRPKPRRPHQRPKPRRHPQRASLPAHTPQPFTTTKWPKIMNSNSPRATLSTASTLRATTGGTAPTHAQVPLDSSLRCVFPASRLTQNYVEYHGH